MESWKGRKWSIMIPELFNRGRGPIQCVQKNPPLESTLLFLNVRYHASGYLN